MTDTTGQQQRRPSAPRVAALAAFALLALCLPGAASAQWTTDAQGNVTTTNAGHVGIGATPDNPEGWAKVLDVFGFPHARFTVRTSNIDSRIMSHDYGWWSAPAGMFVGTRTNHPLTFGTGDTFRMFIATGGNVGIGTTTPAQRLDVQGNVAASGYLGLGTTQPAERLDVRGNFILDAGALFTGTGTAELNRYLNLLNSPGYTSATGLKVGGVLISDDYSYANPGKNDMVVKGRIGIGTAGAPAYKLDVAGAVRSTAGGFVFPDGTTQTTAAGAPSAANITAGQFGQNAGGGNFGFPASVMMNSSNGAFIDTGVNNRFKVCGPNGSCAIAGEYIGGRIRLSRDGSFANAEAQADPGMGGIHAPGNALVGGNLGVGTTAPNATEGYSRLTVQGDNPTAVAQALVQTGGGQVGLVYNRTGGTPARWYQYLPPGSTDFRLYFGDAVRPGSGDKFTVQSATGNVGIGTTAPATKLHVAGDITVDGNINAKYQDVAEWVPSKQRLAAGTVVVLDTAELNHVQASARAYDTGVAGVISAQPGISLGEKGEGKLLVATTGRVKVKVDAARGAIKVGDLLVTSDVAGVAMKSQPLELGGVPIHRPGTLIGKALEPLEKGTGEILVLLSLQ